MKYHRKDLKNTIIKIICNHIQIGFELVFYNKPDAYIYGFHIWGMVGVFSIKCFFVVV